MSPEAPGSGGDRGSKDPAGAFAEDLALVGRIRLGEDGAFDALVRAHAAMLRGLVRRVVAPARDGALAGDAVVEDVLQQVFLTAYRRLETYRGDASLRAWLVALARRESFAALRRERRAHRGREASEEESLLDLGLRAGWGRDPEALAVASEERAFVARAFDRLARDDREVLWLRDVEQWTGPEAAAALGVGLPALKSRLHRARLRFAAALQELSEARDRTPMPGRTTER